MIVSFSHKGLERFFQTGSTAGIQAIHANRLKSILAVLEAADSVECMSLPSLKLHRLKGQQRDIWSVTVQANWRVTFRFTGGNAEIVNYEDYH
ncbi:MAG: type II toxin-antitoxin system RelE/ParE family toxin [Nitrospirae bacterium]|nr:type II toxin-antitoxin system RelE/ParE family toxin [Nitrospirota bacterium]